jgi:hypothetical protein
MKELICGSSIGVFGPITRKGFVADAPVFPPAPPISLDFQDEIALQSFPS